MDGKRMRFEAQVLPHLDAAYRFALGLTRSPADAEDLVQDAMLRALRAVDTVRGASARPWLLAIVRNCFYSTRAGEKRRAAQPLPAAGDEQAPDMFAESALDPENITLQDDRSRAVGRSLTKLSLEHREVLVLREIEDLSYQEIASVTHLPIGTVMSRLARARAAFRVQWLADQTEQSI